MAKKAEYDQDLLLYSVKNASEGIISVEKDGTIVYANKKAYEKLNYSKEEFIGKKVFDVDPNFSKENWNQHWKKVKNKEEVTIESIHISKNGKRIPVRLSINYIKHKGNEIHIIFVKNIAKQKKKEKELIRSRNEYQQLINGMEDSAWVIDFDGNFLNVNNSAVEKLGYSREELMNMTPMDIDSSLSSDKIMQLIKDTKKHGTQRFETKHITKDGEEIPVEIASSLINYHEKEAILSVARNINKRKQAEKEKDQAEKKMVQGQKLESLGHLAGGIAHDFNNILTVIQGHAQMSMNQLDKSNKTYDHIKQICKSGKRAASLTNQLLLFSRQKETELKPINLNKTITNLEKMLVRLLGENIDIQLELDGNLPEIMADKGQIEQIITNLSVNARDAMPDGGELTISTEKLRIDKQHVDNFKDLSPGNYVQLQVKDTGTGISDEIIEKIFDPFFTTKGREEGTGMGLSVIHGIVETHDGEIKVESEPDEGTIFTIYLPASSGQKEKIKSKEETEEITDYKGNNQGILVVEDDNNVLEFTVSALENRNFNIFKTTDVNEAMNIFENNTDSIDLLISDIIMPKIKGSKLADKLKSKSTELDVILTSGYTDKKIDRSKIEDKNHKFL